jgi:hypothetical protein
MQTAKTDKANKNIKFSLCYQQYLQTIIFLQIFIIQIKEVIIRA